MTVSPNHGLIRPQQLGDGIRKHTPLRGVRGQPVPCLRDLPAMEGGDRAGPGPGQLRGHTTGAHPGPSAALGKLPHLSVRPSGDTNGTGLQGWCEHLAGNTRKPPEQRLAGGRVSECSVTAACLLLQFHPRPREEGLGVPPNSLKRGAGPVGRSEGLILSRGALSQRAATPSPRGPAQQKAICGAESHRGRSHPRRGRKARAPQPSPGGTRPGTSHLGPLASVFVVTR